MGENKEIKDLKKRINMRNRTSEWFECGISYLKLNDKGEIKEVKEKYVVEALTFGSAEEVIIKEILPYATEGGVTVRTVARPKYQEVCFSDDAKDDKFYKVKILTKEINENDGSEKEVPSFHLIQASSLETARNAVINTVYEASMADYEIASISKTSVIDVVEKETE